MLGNIFSHFPLAREGWFGTSGFRSVEGEYADASMQSIGDGGGGINTSWCSISTSIFVRFLKIEYQDAFR